MREQPETRDDEERRESNPRKRPEHHQNRQQRAREGRGPAPIIQYPLHQYQTPEYHDGFDRVGEGVRLKGPRNVGAREEEHSDTTLPGLWAQLVDGPVFEDEGEEEHQYA